MDAFLALQNGLYNAVSRGLGIPDGGPFQLFQPSPPLASGSQADALLWNYFNNIPPFSLTHDITQSGGNQFFSNYEGMISALQGAPTTFQQDIGPECYEAWKKFLEGLTPKPVASDLPDIFLRWAASNCRDVAKKGAKDLSAILQDPINEAQFALLAYQDKNPDWSVGYSALAQRLANAPPLNFSTSQWDTNVSNTWTQGDNTASFGLYRTSSPTAPQSQKFADNTVALEISFAHFLNFAAMPGNWFTVSALELAYKNESGPPWNPSSPINWQNTFGPTGNMQRFISTLIVADTININVTSGATYSRTDQQTIQSNKDTGLWPFYNKSNKRAATDVSFSPAGNMTITIKSQPGIPILIGCTVLSTSEYVSLWATSDG